jgi:mono/diheme cytochrome c family protein
VPAPKAQTITFATPASLAQTVGVSATLGATASSGLAVSFASSTAAVCTVSGTTLSFAAAGSCTVTASQGGNTAFLAATPVPRTFTVAAAPPPPPPAPSAANGKLLYNGSIAMTCAGCHGAMANSQKVQNGANNPTVILNAIRSVGQMSSNYTTTTFTSAQLADMAAFIAAPF